MAEIERIADIAITQNSLMLVRQLHINPSNFFIAMELVITSEADRTHTILMFYNFPWKQNHTRLLPASLTF